MLLALALLAVHAASPTELFGYSVCAVADRDGDGIAELAVGSPGFGRGERGHVWVVSGATGEPVHVLDAPPGARAFGARVRALGDLDGDEVDELAVYAELPTEEVVVREGADEREHVLTSEAGERRSVILVLSGATGRPLYELPSQRTPRSPAPFDAVGDVDGDGFEDLVVGLPLDDSGAKDGGAVLLVSGRDGAVRRRWEGDAPDRQLGHHVGGAGDVDGDATPDVLALTRPRRADPRSASSTTGAGRARSTLLVLSGADGRILLRRDDLWGISRLDTRSFAASAGDVDGDGRSEILLRTDDDSVAALSVLDGRVLYRVRPTEDARGWVRKHDRRRRRPRPRRPARLRRRGPRLRQRGRRAAVALVRRVGTPAARRSELGLRALLRRRRLRPGRRGR